MLTDDELFKYRVAAERLNLGPSPPAIVLNLLDHIDEMEAANAALGERVAALLGAWDRYRDKPDDKAWESWLMAVETTRAALFPPPAEGDGPATDAPDARKGEPDERTVDAAGNRAVDHDYPDGRGRADPLQQGAPLDER